MSFDLKCGRRIVWAKHVVFLTFRTYVAGHTESGLSALSSPWTYVAGQKGNMSRHRAVYVCPTLVHLEHVRRTVVFLSMLRAKKVTFLGTAPVYVCPALVQMHR